MLRGFWDELDRRGISLRELERLSGMRRPRRNDLLSTVPVDAMHRFFEAGLKLSGDETLGLSVGRAIGVASLHLIGLIALGSSSLKEAVDLIVRAQPQLARRAPLLVTASDGRLRLGFLSAAAVLGPGARVEAQLTAVLLHDTARHFLVNGSINGSCGLPVVQFPYPAPRDVAQYRHFFPGGVEFDGEGTFVTFPQKALVPRRSGADPALLQRLFDLAQTDYGGASADDDWTCRVRRALQAHAAPRLIDSAVLADQLGVSVRGLARRLASEGTSLSKIEDEVLFERAKALLHKPSLTTTKIADLLGYAEVSSFFRAFRRWSGGLTPSEYRVLYGARSRR